MPFKSSPEELPLDARVLSTSTCIVTIGMGRSGTSAIAGALHILGVNLGKNLIGANRFNIKGHFENAPVVQLNSAILKSLNSFNGDVAPMAPLDEAAAGGYAEQAREIIRAQFEGSPLFGIKDPRMCRVWPVWELAFAAYNAEVRFLLPLRHPLEVVQSLHGYGCATNPALLWWLGYTLDAERHSRRGPRIIVSYRDLLANPKQEMERVASTLGLSWPKPLRQMETSLNTFLDRSMRHRSSDSPAVRAEADAEILAMAESLYDAMKAEPEPGRIDRLNAEFAALVESRRGWRPRPI